MIEGNNDFFEQELFDNQFIETEEVVKEPASNLEDPIEGVLEKEPGNDPIEEVQEDILGNNQGILEEEVEKGTEEVEKEVKVEIEGNPLLLFAKKWKEEGKLPEDLEITDNISEEDLDIALYNHKVNKEKEHIKQEALQELAEKEGLNEEVISTAKKLHYGVTDENIKKEQVYNYLATVNLDPDSEQFENDTLSIGVEFYIDKDFNKEMAEKYAMRDIEDDPEESLTMYQQHFVKKTIDQRNINQQIIQQKQLQAEEAKARKSEKINNFFESRKILDREYTKDQVNFLKDAIYKKDQIYVDPNTGAKKRVTLEQKKILESRNDFDKYLKARFDFILGYDLNKIEGVSETKAKNKILKELGKMIKVQTVDKNTGATNKPSAQEDEELLF
jgi:hypothetical protein